MNAFYSDTFVLPLPEHHRFPMTKYRLVRERLIAEAVLLPEDLHLPDPVAWTDLRQVHDPAYVEAVASGTLPADMQRRIGFPWSPMMVERSRRSVGATLAAARHVLGRPLVGDGLQTVPRQRVQAIPGRDGLKAVPYNPDRATLRSFAIAANLAGGTHHAFRDRGEGFCVFNDVAVAATVLLRDGAIARAAVVDCDVHQGNGTAAIFRDEPAVFTFSLHGEKNFPFRKEVSDLDISFADGTGDDEYLAALAAHLPKVLDAHHPDIVFYLAGADPYEDDRLGRLRLSIEGLRTRDRFVFDSCRSRGIPIVVTMSGGYAPDVNAIVTIHCNTIREAVRVLGAECCVQGAVPSATVPGAVPSATVHYAARAQYSTQHPEPSTAPSTQHSTQYSAPSTAPSTRHSTQHPAPSTAPSTRHSTQHPAPSTAPNT